MGGMRCEKDKKNQNKINYAINRRYKKYKIRFSQKMIL